jgi:hypothetical protein
MKPSVVTMAVLLVACRPEPAPKTAGMFDLLAHAATDAMNTLPPPPPKCPGALWYVADGDAGWHCSAPIEISGNAFGAFGAPHCSEVPTDGGRGEIQCVVGATEVLTVHYDRIDAGARLLCGGGPVVGWWDQHGPTFRCRDTDADVR